MPKKFVTTLQDDIDELGRLEAEGVSTKYARMSALRKKIVATLPDHTLDTTLRGFIYGAIIGAPTCKRFIDLQGLFRRITPKAFIAALRPDAVTLDTFQGFPERVQAGLITESQTGPRFVKTFHLVADAKAA
jgi:hypothetical protein